MGVAKLCEPRARVLKSLNCDGYRGVALAGVACCCSCRCSAGRPGNGCCATTAQALAAGQWWRLLTAHLVHLDLRHARAQHLGLALMWALFARDYSARQWLLIVLGAIAAIDAGLWLADSTVQWYVGSSGALHGVMAAGALAHLRTGQRDGWILWGCCW